MLIFCWHFSHVLTESGDPDRAEKTILTFPKQSVALSCFVWEMEIYGNFNTDNEAQHYTLSRGTLGLPGNVK